MLTAYGSAFVTKELEHNEANRHRLAQLFFGAYGFWPESVEGDGLSWILTGVCEGCSQPIFEDEESQAYEDGIITHKGPCPNPAKADAEGPHGSMVLKLMGVPATPTEGKEG